MSLPMAVVVGFLLKLAWGIVVVTVVASQEPVWDQAIIVLGGAVITATSIVIAAMITSRQVKDPVENVQVDLQEHRAVVEEQLHKADS